MNYSVTREINDFGAERGCKSKRESAYSFRLKNVCFGMSRCVVAHSRGEKGPHAIISEHPWGKKRQRLFGQVKRYALPFLWAMSERINSLFRWLHKYYDLWTLEFYSTNTLGSQMRELGKDKRLPAMMKLLDYFSFSLFVFQYKYFVRRDNDTELWVEVPFEEVTSENIRGEWYELNKLSVFLDQQSNDMKQMPSENIYDTYKTILIMLIHWL